MSLADLVSIPSTLANPGPPPPDRPTANEVRLRRLQEAHIEPATCPTCGLTATREEVLIHRPGQPSVVRILLRCLRFAVKGRGNGQSRVQEARANQACPVHIESETPVEAVPQEEVSVSQTVTPVTPCPCDGCGNTVPQGRKFCSSHCSNKFNARRSAEARRARREAASAREKALPAPPTPELRSRVSEAAATTRNAVSLLALATQLLQLPLEHLDLVRQFADVPADERDLVLRLVQAERLRRSAA